MFILGTKVHNITLAQALKKAEGFLGDGTQHYIVTPNPEIVLQAQNDSNYRKILNRADLNLPDGAGLLWASRRLQPKNPLKERITGVDFMVKLLSHLSHRSYPTYRILLLGGKNGVAKKVASIFQGQFFNFDFYGIENVENKYLNFVIKEVIQPNCIFVALGAPRQEQWIYDNLKKFPSVKFAMGVGGAFDMISGRTQRAPRAVRESDGEWLWRLFLQPWRIKRIFSAVAIFPFRVYFSRKN